MKFVVISFLLWRLLLFLPLAIAPNFIPYNPGADYTNIWKFTQPYFPIDSVLLFPFANFDGVHYLTIAGNGYASDGSNARFLPLFPLLIYGASIMFGNTEAFSASNFFAGLLISNLCFLISLILLYRLIRIDYDDTIAKKTILFFLVFPTAFFFGSIYAESLFLLLVVLSFLLLRKRQFVTSGITGFLLSLTRVVGISIFPAALYEYWIQQKKISKKQALAKLISLLFIPLGTLILLYVNYTNWENPFHFLNAHGDLGNSRSVSAVVIPLQTIVRYGKILLSLPVAYFEWWIALLEVTVFCCVAGLLYAGYKLGIRKSYLIFSLFCFFIPASTGTFTGLPRYSAVIFPIFLALALTKNKFLQILYCAIGVITQILLLAFFSRGYYVA